MIHECKYCKKILPAALKGDVCFGCTDKAKIDDLRNALNNIYINATSDDTGEHFVYYLDENEMLALEKLLDL